MALKTVVIDAPVVFQINGHLNEAFPSPAGGILLGTGPDERPAEETCRVTESFALPQHVVDGGSANFRSKEATAYTNAVVANLSKVGADQHVEGWYISSSVGAIYDATIFENLYAFQKSNADAFLLVLDVALSRATGTLGLRAFRLSEAYLDVRKAGSRISSEQLLNNQLDYTSILEELVVEVSNPHLVSLFLANRSAAPSEPLKVPSQDLLETNADSAMEAVDDFNYEQGSYNYYQRQLVREKQKISAWQAKRKAENQQREARGEKLLPTDEYKSLFRLPEEPSRLDNLLVSAQLGETCHQIEELAGVSGSLLLSAKCTLP